MDPVSAFGLAVNVLAVVDFSKTFLEVLKQVKDHGSSAATQDIVSISRSLQESCAKAKLPTSAEVDDDKAFTNLVEECQNLAGELIRLTDKISTAGSNTMMKRVKVTALTMWSHSEIEEKKTRLGAIRAQLLFDVVVPMAEKVNRIPDMAAMDTQTRTLLDEIKAGQDANHALEKRLGGFHEEYATVQAERHTEIVSMLDDIRGSKLQPVTSQTRHRSCKPKTLILEDLLNFLYFPQEVDRLYDIKPAHKGTFEWIYSEPRSGANRGTWANFYDWLRNDSGIYRVSGKAGSGKSTLMKLIGTDDRTRQPLLDWSAGSRLLILSFYFWNPGTPLQKSFEGLLRSIISQALKECPELADRLFPDRFERRTEDQQSPTIQELERAFGFLTGQGLTDASLNSIKLILLIDGLDEFDAGSMSLADLSTIFTKAAHSPSFKAVLSSRPENAFEEAFNSCPKLRLHFLTHNDVVQYVDENLRGHPRMIQLVAQAPEESASLVQEIVEAAQGVFLWVKVVVRSLLEGLRNHDEITILTERLRELPTDLEDLFRVMLDRVPRIYKQTMSKTFQIMRSVTELRSRFEPRSQGGSATMMCEMRPLTALGLKFALLHAKTILQADIGQMPVERASEEINSIEAQIKVSCSGLIELRGANGHYAFGTPIEPVVTTEPGEEAGSAVTKDMYMDDLYDPEIHFIHRSVSEYLSKEDVWDKVLLEVEQDFQPHAAFLQGLVMQAKCCSYRYGTKRDWNRPPWDTLATALEIARIMEEERGLDQLDMLNALGTALTTRCGLEWWDTYEEDYNRPVQWHDNFFAVAIRYGLSRYVESRLRGHGQQIIEKPGRPLLDYACRPEPSYSVWLRALDVRVVKALLQHGADPNKTFNGFTPWQNAWYTVREEGGPVQLFLPIFEVMLEYGADENAYIEFEKRLSKRVWQRRRLSVLAVALELKVQMLERRNRADIVEDDNGEVTRGDEVTDYDRRYEDSDLSDLDVCYRSMRRLITQLRKKGARARAWREVDGVFIRQGSSSWSAKGRALQAQAQRAQAHCVLL